MPMMVDNQKYYREMKLFPEVFTFLFVGRLIDTKNVDVLCERFIHFFSSQNVRLIIVGDGENLSKFQMKYLHPKIEFKGSVFGEDLIQLYHDASVFVFPSSLDAWGLVVNEAMSASLPVITHKSVGANHDLIKDKNTGMIASNMDDFGEKMLELYNDADLLMRFSKNAYYLMRNNWNYDLYNKCLKDAIKKVEQWG
jgi:glycosyltransferase involved in cell wall biosynthesis